MARKKNPILHTKEEPLLQSNEEVLEIVNKTTDLKIILEDYLPESKVMLLGGGNLYPISGVVEVEDADGKFLGIAIDLDPILQS